MRINPTAALIYVTVAVCTFVAVLYLWPGGEPGEVAVVRSSTAPGLALPLPDTAKGWWLSNIETARNTTGEGMRLADTSTTAYAFAELTLPALAAGVRLSVIMEVGKAPEGGGSVFASRVALSDTESATCAFSTFSGARTAWGVSGVAAQAADMGERWRLECIVPGPAKAIDKPVLRLLPSLGPVPDKTAPDSTGSVNLLSLRVVRGTG